MPTKTNKTSTKKATAKLARAARQGAAIHAEIASSMVPVMETFLEYVLMELKKARKPAVVTIVGRPKSGKTTVIDGLSEAIRPYFGKPFHLSAEPCASKLFDTWPIQLPAGAGAVFAAMEARRLSRKGIDGQTKERPVIVEWLSDRALHGALAEVSDVVITLRRDKSSSRKAKFFAEVKLTTKRGLLPSRPSPLFNITMPLKADL